MSVVTFPVSLGGDGVAYSDDGSTPAKMVAGGHKVYLFAALQALINAASTAYTAAANSTGTAGATGTSASSIAAIPATGADVTLTTQSGKTWVPGQPVIVANTGAPATRWVTGFVKSYATTTLVVTVIDAAGTFPGSAWTISPCALAPVRSMRYASTALSITTLTAQDAGEVLSYSGALVGDSIVLPDAKSVGAGWFTYVRNGAAATSEVWCYLSPTGTDRIDGTAAPIRMYPREMRMVYSTGSEWLTVIVSPFVLVMTASGTWYKPTGYDAFRVACIGGGGGGGSAGAASGATYSSGGSAGNGGCELVSSIRAALVPGSVTVTVGAGGSGGLAVSGSNVYGNVGTAGGASSFGSLFTAGGGQGGGRGSYGGSAAASASDATPTNTLNAYTANDLNWCGGWGGASIAPGYWSSAGGQRGGYNVGLAGGLGILGGAGGGNGRSMFNGVQDGLLAAGATVRSEIGGALSGAGGQGGNGAGIAGSAGKSGGGGGGGGSTQSGSGAAGGAGGAGLVIIYGVV